MPFSIPKHCPSVSHLAFADDMIIFANAFDDLRDTRPGLRGRDAAIDGERKHTGKGAKTPVNTYQRKNVKFSQEYDGVSQLL